MKRKRWKHVRIKLSVQQCKKLKKAAAFALCIAVVVGLLRVDNWVSQLWNPIFASAGIVLPEGGEEWVRNNETIQKLFAAAEPVAPPAESEGPAQSEAPSSRPQQDPVSSEMQPVSSQTDSSLPEGWLPVKEVLLTTTGNLSFGNVSMRSRSATNIDVETELSRRPDVTLRDTDEPQVLIVHTHTSEAYMESFTGNYPTSYDPRTNVGAHSVIRVGDAIAQKLNSAGITTIHDTTFHDDPAYKGAYTRSMATMESYLKKYPSIQVILDVHRDCLEQPDGTKLKPTVEINGKKAAQVMIVSGCDDNGTLGYPEWEYNLRFGLRLQQSLSTKYPGLARPLYCWNIRYNQHLSHGALLVEFGTEANTYDEVQYSGELFADCLTDVLESLKES